MQHDLLIWISGAFCGGVFTVIGQIVGRVFVWRMAREISTVLVAILKERTV